MTDASHKLVAPAPKPKRSRGLIWAGLAVVAGIFLVIRIFAAGTPTAFEAESGTVSGSAAKVPLTGASGSSAVKFAAAATPPPTATPVPTPTATPPAGTKPTAANTGVPAGTTLTVVNGNVTVTASGTVIDGQRIKGFLIIKASNVTVRNTYVEGGTTSGVAGAIDVQSGSNILIEDVTVAVAHPSPGIDGVWGSNFTGRRLNISGGVDGMKLDTGADVENSYIHDLQYFASDPSQGGGETHNDGIQILSGTGITVRGNNIPLIGSNNAAVQVTQDFGVVNNLHIENNWFDGGGCTLNIAHKVQSSLAGIFATGNRFGHNSGFSNCAILISTKTTLTASGNVWDVAPNAGQTVPVQQHD